MNYKKLYYSELLWFTTARSPQIAALPPGWVSNCEAKLWDLVLRDDALASVVLYQVVSEQALSK